MLVHVNIEWQHAAGHRRTVIAPMEHTVCFENIRLRQRAPKHRCLYAAPLCKPEILDLATVTLLDSRMRHQQKVKT